MLLLVFLLRKASFVSQGSVHSETSRPDGFATHGSSVTSRDGLAQSDYDSDDVSDSETETEESDSDDIGVADDEDLNEVGFGDTVDASPSAYLLNVAD